MSTGEGADGPGRPRTGPPVDVPEGSTGRRFRPAPCEEDGGGATGARPPLLVSGSAARSHRHGVIDAGQPATVSDQSLPPSPPSPPAPPAPPVAVAAADVADSVLSSTLPPMKMTAAEM